LANATFFQKKILPGFLLTQLFSHKCTLTIQQKVLYSYASPLSSPLPLLSAFLFYFPSVRSSAFYVCKIAPAEVPTRPRRALHTDRTGSSATRLAEAL
jgi:hypothetical protein